MARFIFQQLVLVVSSPQSNLSFLHHTALVWNLGEGKIDLSMQKCEANPSYRPPLLGSLLPTEGQAPPQYPAPQYKAGLVRGNAPFGKTRRLFSQQGRLA